MQMSNASDKTMQLELIKVTPFINGESASSTSEELLEVINPTNGKKLTDIPAGCDSDVGQAVASARLAFDDGRWSQLLPSQRRALLHRFGDLIEEEASQLDILDSLDMGKPLSVRLGNAVSAANYVRYCADAIDKVMGDVYQSDHTTFITQQRLPRGVVAAVVPWNFPTMSAALKFAPALAAGNCVVLKPSECASQSAMRLVQLATQAGLPPGVLNMVPGRGDIVGRALALHNDVDMMTFTGSTLVGKLMFQYAGKSNMKLVQAECGGKSPQIVFADFGDLDTVADNVAQLILVNQGQLCVAGSRLLVQKEIEADLIEKVAIRLKAFVAGDPLDTKTTFGPLVNHQQLEKVLSYIASGRESGAELVCGGNRILEDTGGYFVEPTLFANVSPDAKIAQEEIFGPVLSVSSFRDEEEAIQLANSTAYGLDTHVWTSNLSTGMKLSKYIRASMVSVYSAAPGGEGSGAMSTEPYGLSGVGVDGGQAGLETYLRRQVTWFNHG